MIENTAKGLLNYIEELAQYTEWEKSMEEKYDKTEGHPRRPSFKKRLSSMSSIDRIEFQRWKDRLAGMEAVLEMGDVQLQAILVTDELRHPERDQVHA